jgi:DNA-binding transcriptional LysR family regulator
MELIEVEAFVTIAELGRFARSATALHISQPAISRRIDLLERELGAPLFERMRGGARLTEAGHAFLPHARHLLAAARDGAAAVRALEHEDSGTITLALVGTLASTALPGQLQHFRAAHPRVRLRLRTARSEEVSALVQRGEATLGLRYFADADPTVVSRLVREEALVVVCAAQSRLVEQTTPDLAALAGIPWVAFPAGGSAGEPYARIVERQLHGAGLADAEILPIDSLTAQKRLIEADFGLGLLPASSITEEVRLGTLRTLELPALCTTLPVMAIYRRQAYLSRAANQLLAELIALS